MTQDELEKCKNRLYELKDLSISALNNKNYVALTNYSKEIKQIHKKLKKARKEIKKRENR